MSDQATANNVVTVLLASCGRDVDSRAAARLRSEEDLRLVAEVDDPGEVIQSVVSVRPDVAVIFGRPDHSWKEICAFLSLGAPTTKIILVLDDIDAQAISEAMLLGVRQVLKHPVDTSHLVEVISKISRIESIRESDEFAKATDPKEYPRLIALSGAKGGVGKTTVTANLGVSLAQLHSGSVVIWDAYSQFGDVANMLGLAPTRVLADIREMQGDIDDAYILDHAMKHESGADVLLTSDKPLAWGSIQEQLAERAIRALRRRYRFIVADTPPTLCPLSAQVFRRCWLLLVVTTSRDVTAVSDSMRLVNMLEPDYVRGERIQVVVNRITRSDSIKESEIESLIGRRVLVSIPEDPQVAQANNLGRPVVTASPKSPAAKQIRRAAETIVQLASTFSLAGGQSSSSQNSVG